MTTTQSITLGLAANWRQFTLLVVINAFVGAMVGLERAALPLVASREFNIASTTVALAFIAHLASPRPSPIWLPAGWLIEASGGTFSSSAGSWPSPFLRSSCWRETGHGSSRQMCCWG